jgi:16S rRNA (adenine1518-N6/adenine1519-N6)-dimethyltransferase
LSSPLTSPRVVRQILDRYGLSPNKRLGQNFLIDKNILQIIGDTAAVGPTDTVVEVGAGLGTLTGLLSQRAQKVIAIELDRGFIPVLRENLAAYDNVRIICGDILKLDLKQELSSGDQEVKVVANLPYYITSAVIMKLLEEDIFLDKIVVMVQREVAQRLVARPGEKAYGILSLAVQYYTMPEIVKVVPATAFYPRPDVASAVVRLAVRQSPPVEVGNRDLFFRIIRGGFRQRRKTLLNSLQGEFRSDFTREELLGFLNKAGIDPVRRGETLHLDEYGQLSRIFASEDP